MQQFFGWMSQSVLALALPYFAISLALGIRVATRGGLKLGSQEREEPAVEAERHDGLYFIVPCLNEELVIGQTVRRLLAQPGCTVLVVDDGSTDETALRAQLAAQERAEPERQLTLTRRGEESRQGKSQFARSISGTVSLGGNGQFTRLNALEGLDGEPWSRSLTEDQDLGLRLIAKSWRITTPVHGYVDQQPVDTLPRLLRQRTRWYQGSRSQQEHVGAPATATVAPALTITGDRELA